MQILVFCFKRNELFALPPPLSPSKKKKNEVSNNFFLYISEKSKVQQAVYIQHVIRNATAKVYGILFAIRKLVLHFIQHVLQVVRSKLKILRYIILLVL